MTEDIVPGAAPAEPDNGKPAPKKRKATAKPRKPRKPRVVAPTKSKFPAAQELYDSALKSVTRHGMADHRRIRKQTTGEEIPDTIRDRDAAIYCEWIKGKTQQQIGNEVGLTKGAISVIVRKVAKKLEPLYADYVKELRFEHSERLMHIYRESMAAWERSQEVSVSVTSTTGEKAGDSTTLKGQVGDSGFLGEARATLADIRKIWGADKPPASGPEDAESYRVAGKPIAQVVQERINHLQARLAQMTNPEPSAN